MLFLDFLYWDLLFYLSMLCSFIPCWVICVLFWQMFTFMGPSRLADENNVLEFGWTVLPTTSVTFLCYFNLCCIAGDLDPIASIMVKAVGRQWYWSYEISGDETLYDSVMLDFIDSVDKPLRLLWGGRYHLVITSSDVIHSFTLPSCGIKADAIPGRINNVSMIPDRVGVHVGYCSELCGAGHAYMPIVLEVVGAGVKRGW